MSSSVHIKASILFLTFLFIGACAKIGQPSGGPRDRTPPVVLRTTPEAYSTNFKGRRIIITLDEYVQLDNINENLIISPPLSSRPKVWLRGKNVIVDIDEDLKENFTYTFNFQNAIKDLNEGNILEGYRFVVSTGDVLDSLSVTGNVYYAENLEIPEKIFVLLHSNPEDTAVRKTLPDYIGIIDRNGYFSIDNVKPGNYMLYALKDLNNNRRYDLADEEFAFLDYPVEVFADTTLIEDIIAAEDIVAVSADTTAISKPLIMENELKTDADTTILIGENRLFMFQKAFTTRYLKSSQRKSKRLLEFVLSLPPLADMPAEFTLSDFAENTYITEQSLNRDTILVWLIDSMLVETNPVPAMIKYPFTDSIGAVVYKTDTINLRFVEARPTRGATTVVQPILALSNNSQGGIKPGQKFVFRSETPLVEPDTSMMRLFEIKERDTLKIPLLLQKDSITTTKYIIENKLLADKRYFFVADSGAFRDVYDVASDSIGITFSLRSEDAYGKLTFNIQNIDEAIIVQLLDRTEARVVAEALMNESGKAVFPLLDPATYRARIIFDTNNDGKWTPGDFDEKRQPEQVTYYPDEIEVRARFEIEQDWNVEARNEKNQKLRAVKR